MEIGYITVKLMDSYHNPVMFKVKELYVETGDNMTHRGFRVPIKENFDGTYTGGYFYAEPGNYELCVKFNKKCFLPNHLGVIVHDRKLKNLNIPNKVPLLNLTVCTFFFQGLPILKLTMIELMSGRISPLDFIL